MKIKPLGGYNGRDISCAECTAKMYAQGATKIVEIQIGDVRVRLCHRHVEALSNLARLLP